MIFLASLFLFGFSKFQHMAFPALFAFILLVGGLLGKRRQVLTLAWQAGAVAILVLMVQGRIMSKRPDFGASTTSDMLLGAVLPASPDPDSALKIIGLPLQCKNAIGLTWFENRVSEIKASCPQVFSFSRTGLVPLLGSAARDFRNRDVEGVAAGETMDSGQLFGVVEGQAGGALDQSKPQNFSFANYVKFLSDDAWFFVHAIQFAVMLIAGVSCGRAFMTRAERDDGPSSCWFSHDFIGSCHWCDPDCRFFGNGYSEVARHSHLGYSYTSVLFLWIAGCSMVFFARRLADRSASA